MELDLQKQARQFRRLLESQADTLTDEQILAYPAFVEKWADGVGYLAGKRLEYNGKVYKVKTNLTSSTEATPDESPELYDDISKHDDNELENLKTQKIAESKKLLNNFLIDHPLISKCKYEDGRAYNVTAEKQSQLASKIAIATMYKTANIPYEIRWNDTGNVCEAWTMEQITQLAMEMDAYVTPLVTIQQTYEKQVVAAQSADEVNAITLNYEAVLVDA